MKVKILTNNKSTDAEMEVSNFLSRKDITVHQVLTNVTRNFLPHTTLNEVEEIFYFTILYTENN